jgi:mono/diheme cytochrome c family protein
MQVPRFVVFATLAVGWLLQSYPAHADVANGERLAKQWCAQCHVIDASGPSSTLPQGPPSFRVAAGHLNSGELRAFLTHPHGQMPDLALTRSEIDDLIGYIESLR